MTIRSFHLPEALHDYLVAVSCREQVAQTRLREATAGLPEAHYQIAPEQGQLLTFVIEMIGARRTLDIGTFTGYSALTAALALPEDGQVVTFDLTDRFAAMAWRAWRDASVVHKIDARHGPAADGLRALLAAGESESFDFAFVDADKEGYPDYYELALALIRPGGIVALDNTLWRGRVADPADTRPRTAAMRSLNAEIRDDERVTPVLLPMGDGITLARKRPKES